MTNGKYGFGVDLIHRHLWRIQITIAATILVTAGATTCWHLHSVASKFKGLFRSSRESTRLATSIDSLSSRIRAITEDTSVVDEVKKWRLEAESARKQFSMATLTSVNQKLSQLLERLKQESEKRKFTESDDDPVE